MSLLQTLPYSLYNNLIKNKDWTNKITAKPKFRNLSGKDPQEMINYFNKTGYDLEKFYKLLESCHISPKTGESISNDNSAPVLKIAVLVANAAYEHWVHLITPASDCKILGDILKSMGFTTIFIKNTSSELLKKSISELCAVIPAKSYVLFYFAGHGFELCGTKYMLGVESPPVKYTIDNGISENFIIKNGFVSNPDVLILLLDMCRKQPDRTINPDIYSNIPPTEEYSNACNLIIGYATSPYMPAYEKSCCDSENTESKIQHDSCESVHIENSNSIGNRATCKLNSEKRPKGISLYVNHLSKHLKRNENFVHILELVNKEFANEKCEQAIVSKQQKPQKLDNVAKEFYLHVKAKGDKDAQKQLRDVVENLSRVVDITLK